jgi:hypothetical protein
MSTQELDAAVDMEQVPRASVSPPPPEACACPEFCLLDHNN